MVVPRAESESPFEDLIIVRFGEDLSRYCQDIVNLRLGQLPFPSYRGLLQPYRQSCFEAGPVLLFELK
jgi:hypothetical protein